jgi:hypothetical protein
MLEEQDYLRRRELEERAAEKNASCDAARRAHHELAEEYAERLRVAVGEGQAAKLRCG